MTMTSSKRKNRMKRARKEATIYRREGKDPKQKRSVNRRMRRLFHN